MNDVSDTHPSMGMTPKERAVLVQIADALADLLDAQAELLGPLAHHRRAQTGRAAVKNLREPPAATDQQRELGELLDLAASAVVDGRRAVMTKALGQLTTRLGKLVIPEHAAALANGESRTTTQRIVVSE